MRRIQDFHSYNESVKSILTGSALILSLVSNQSKAQDSKKELKQKALMSKVDSVSANKIVDSLISKRFEIVKKQQAFENKFLISSGSGITSQDAIDRAKDDMKAKINFLGRPGAESIYLYEQSKNYHAVIITEILPKKEGMYDPVLNIYR